MAGTSLILFIAASGQLRYAIDVLYLLQIAIGGSGSLIIIVAILPVFPYSMSFVRDWENRASAFWMIRSGINNYTISKYISTGVSAFLTTSLGMTLFVLVFSYFYPLFKISSSGDPYEPFLLAGYPMAYTAFFIVHYSLSSVLLVGVAIWMSTVIPNRYTTVAAPLVIYLTAHRIGGHFQLPPLLQPVMWVEGTYHAGSPEASLFVKFITVTVLYLVMMLLSVRRVRKLVRND